jgi:hypothetical protein
MLRGAAFALAFLLAGCAGREAATNAAPPSYRRAADATPTGLPPGWGRLKPLLDQGQQHVAAHDLAGLKALAPRINAEGLGLLKANMPNDVARPDALAFLEGRAVFGRALLLFAEAVEGHRDAELPDLFLRLTETWYAWMAAMRGLPPERSV